MLSDIDVRVESQHKLVSDLTQEDKLYITEQMLHHIEKDLILKEERFFGSDTFEKYQIKDLFEDNILRKYTIKKNSQAEFELSQKNPAETITMKILIVLIGTHMMITFVQMKKNYLSVY